MLEDCSFCPACNFAESKICIEQARCDFRCPNCKGAKLSEFYSIGSSTHKFQLTRWYDRHNRHPKALQPPMEPEKCQAQAG